ncbi:hypothetical protein NQ176_g313 [Zarea fungicola]|uniref:Uncharacterized protein n=1 Tax=Zarea fungicola TaxID=93591 RepID=A0ACC1NZH5_9HYPO|nr:hypothetical protein NQ176_g313 [Lecanicillium fungicola]
MRVNHDSISRGYSQSPSPAARLCSPSHGHSDQAHPTPFHISSYISSYQNYGTPHHLSRGYPSFTSHGRYNATHRYGKNWTYHEALGLVGSNSETIFDFTTNGSGIQEQYGGQQTLAMLPREDKANDMTANVDHVKRFLEQVHSVVQYTERARDVDKANKDGNHAIRMNNDGMSSCCPLKTANRSKRVAAPGRCHRCNTTTTPEWRRGPNGARTLCNACGLQYSKQQRKHLLQTKLLQYNTEVPNRDTELVVKPTGMGATSVTAEEKEAAAEK